MTVTEHRSFPEAADGRPALPMEPELWAAGCDLETARFVARQLDAQGYTLIRAEDIERIEAENKRLREALEGICAPEYGLHGIIEDYGDDANAYNYHAAEYWEGRAMAKSQRARAALKE